MKQEKYVTSQQGWKCKHCDEQLKATFQVDHKIDLRYGGTNHVSNLVLWTECRAKQWKVLIILMIIIFNSQHFLQSIKIKYLKYIR